jgi:hypothetical protein
MQEKITSDWTKNPGVLPPASHHEGPKFNSSTMHVKCVADEDAMVQIFFYLRGIFQLIIILTMPHAHLWDRLK